MTATLSTPEPRILLRQEQKWEPMPWDMYDMGSVGYLLPCDSITNADHVSSHVDGGAHAPALDIDMPATLVPQAEGTTTLWVDLRVSPRRWNKALAAFHQAGVAAPAAKVSRRELRARYEADRARAADVDLFSRTVAALGDTLDCTETVFSVAAEIVGRETAPAPAFKNPRPVTFTVPVTLVRSQTNNHLYVDARMPWVAYSTLLDGLRAGRLLERSWVKLAKRREFTALRLPWLY